MNVVAVRLATAIGLLKVAVTTLFVATPVTTGLLAAGVVAVTAGGTDEPAPGVPRIGSRLLPPQAARRAANNTDSSPVDLANLVRPRYVVPHHYDMFTFNTAPPGVFEDESRRLAPGVSPRVLRCGERWEVRR